MFTNKKREGINTFVFATSIYVVEKPKASINEYELPLLIISFIDSSGSPPKSDHQGNKKVYKCCWNDE